MMTSSQTRAVALTLALALPLSLLTSCKSLETREGAAGAGALAGALIGAGVGYAIDDSAEGAVIGGLAGALAGGIIGYAVGDRLEDRDEASRVYSDELSQPGVSEVLDIRNVRVSPDSVRAGDQIDVSVIHSYVGPVDQVQPFDVEVKLVDDKGAVLMTQNQRQEYENGTYSSTITFEVPKELPPGRHGIDVTMRTGGVADNASALVSVL